MKQAFYVKVMILLVLGFTCYTTPMLQKVNAAAPRQMEALDRGVVAVQLGNGVFVSWRLFGTDPSHIAFNLYRNGMKITANPIGGSTNFLDSGGNVDSIYTIKPVLNNVEGPPSAPAGVWGQNYLTVPLERPTGGTTPSGENYTYSPNDASVGDLDGDGSYEIVLKWEPSNAKDSSFEGYTGPVMIDSYRLDGTRLWRINLGQNIRAGAHYTQFLVYDFDGDGRSEVVMKTADGTIDGLGTVIGNANADHRNTNGRILTGPEFLTVFDGLSGQALSTINYEPARGNVSDWGDNYGNRVSRFLAGVAYLDGTRPSIIMARGYYAKSVIVAYNWRDGQFTKLWTFDSTTPGNQAYGGQGNHSLSIGDVDEDGRDEIIYGSMALDNDGTPLYTTGLGHGDALHLSDFNPSRPGLEVYGVHEWAEVAYGAELHDAASGSHLWGVHTGRDTGRGLASDIDPRYPGAEMWATSGVGVRSATGALISSGIPSINFAIYWDGDLLRELLDNSGGVGKIDKWNYTNSNSSVLLNATGTVSINGTKGNPSLQADILGDWREEAIWPTSDSTSLRIYTTTDVTDQRIYTLMHDPLYRLSVAWQNVAYNQPPHTGFFLGHGMAVPPTPNIYLAEQHQLLSVGKPATASIASPDFPASQANDADATSFWTTGNRSLGASWLVDLQQVAKIDLTHIASWNPIQYKIEVSHDNLNFTTAFDHTVTLTTGNESTDKMPSNTYGRYVRVTITGTQYEWNWVQLYDFKVYGTFNANLSLGKPATASGALTGHPASLANDASKSTFWTTGNHSLGSTWTVDLERNAKINRTYIASWNPIKYKIEVSSDNNNYVTIFDHTANLTGGNSSLDMMPSNAYGRYVRVTITDTENNWNWIQLSDFQVYGVFI